MTEKVESEIMHNEITTPSTNSVHSDPEKQESAIQYHDIGDIHGFAADLENLPKGYYYSPKFIGSMSGVFFGLMAGVGGYAVAAPILGVINADIGPSPNYIWIAIVYSLCLAIGLMFVGRLSDIFGRRWFFIGGGVFALLGAIVCGTAKSVNVMIGGMTLIGLGAAAQLSFPFAVGELVPMKHRFAGNAVMYVSTLPMSAFGPAVANACLLHTPAGWRTGYYALIAVDGISLLCYILFYFPPTFKMKHQNDTLAHWIRHFDYVGSILFTAGLLLFLMGLSWGGSVYPWKSAHVIATMVIGIVTSIAFVLWEIYADLKEPLMPMGLFRKGQWVACWISLGLGAAQYYALAIVWPGMVGTLYSDGEPLNGGWLACLVGVGIVTGQLFSGALTRHIGKTKIQVIVVFALGGLFYGLVATCDATTKSRAIGLVWFGSFFIGWNESVVLALCTIAIDDQREIGTAAGIAGSMRALISSIVSTVYVVVLTNRLTETISSYVPTALIGAGLPADSITAWLTGLTTGALDTVPGTNDAINAAGAAAYQLASSDAYATVFFTTLAFTGLGVIVNFFVPNVDDKMSDGVAATLKAGGH